jgi:hypothetical protein
LAATFPFALCLPRWLRLLLRPFHHQLLLALILAHSRIRLSLLALSLHRRSVSQFGNKEDKQQNKLSPRYGCKDKLF